MWFLAVSCFGAQRFRGIPLTIAVFQDRQVSDKGQYYQLQSMTSHLNLAGSEV